MRERAAMWHAKQADECEERMRAHARAGSKELEETYSMAGSVHSEGANKILSLPLTAPSKGGS
jgi:hypothetical protein